MDKIGIYPGTFDPLTFGHIDVIKRSLKIVDKLIIGIADNDNKTPLLSIEERKLLLKIYSYSNILLYNKNFPLELNKDALRGRSKDLSISIKKLSTDGLG